MICVVLFCSSQRSFFNPDRNRTLQRRSLEVRSILVSLCFLCLIDAVMLLLQVMAFYSNPQVPGVHERLELIGELTKMLEILPREDREVLAAAVYVWMIHGAT